MKKFLLIIFTSVLFLSSPIVVTFVPAQAADTNTTSPLTDTISKDQQAASQDLDVILSHGEQNPAGKSFDLIANITSNIDSDRVIVAWKLPSTFTFADEKQLETEQTEISKGGSQVVRVAVKGNYAGTYTVGVEVTAVKADVNYITSDNLEITLNEKREVLPITDKYKNAKLVNQLKNVAVVLFILGVIGGASFWLFRRYKMATSK